MAEVKQTGTSAGRGVIYIAFAKFYFMVAGLVVVFRLPGILNHASWGAYNVVNSLVSPVNNVLNTGTIQSVSRFSAQEPEKARRVQNAGLRMHPVFHRDDGEVGAPGPAARISSPFAATFERSSRV